MADYIDEASEMLAGEDSVSYRKKKSPVERAGFSTAYHALTFWKKLSSEAYRVYLAYRSFADMGVPGETFVGVAKLAKVMGMSEPSIKRARAELVELKLITIVSRGYGKTRMVLIEDEQEHEELKKIAESLLAERRSSSIGIKNDPSLRSKMIPSLGSKMISHNKNNEEEQVEEDLSAAPSSGGRGRSVPKLGYREEPERVAVGDENGNERNDARAQNGLERYILRQCQGNPQYLSPTNRRKLQEPIYVYKGKAQIEEPSPLLEWERDSEGFEEWVGTVANYVGGKGNRPTLAKLIQAIRNNYDAEGWGWLAVRANDLPVDDPSQPWNQ